MSLLVYGLLVVAICAGLAYYLFFRDRFIRRRRFPTEWEQMLRTTLPVYDSLDAAEQRRLRELIQLFLARKTFYGCAGLEITDEIRVAVAGQACLLLLNRGWQVYPGLMSILVYPSAFRARREQHRDDGTVAMEHHDLLGESWSNGKVILSWDDVTHGIADFTDGHNVVLHEFAHQLDGQSGVANGAPPLRRNSYGVWARVFSENFDDLRKRATRGQKTVMDRYGATNPAEFFAVATESFFEQPHALFERRPDLYEELRQYYQLDPREWQR